MMIGRSWLSGSDFTFEQVEAAHLASRVEPEVEDHAVEVLLVELAERFLGGADGGYIDIIVRNQLDDTLALLLVVLNDQQAFRNGVDESGDSSKRRIERFLANRLGEEGNRAGVETRALSSTPDMM